MIQVGTYVYKGRVVNEPGHKPGQSVQVYGTV